MVYFNNSKQRNKLCKGTKNSKGYTQVQINGKSELLHRVIYEYHYNIKLGAHDIIDHIDRNKDNNRIGNLRKGADIVYASNTKENR